MTSPILLELGPSCRDVTRRSTIVSTPGLGLNGIDFVEYKERALPPKHVLEVHFLSNLPAGAYGIPADLSLIRIDGGSRIINVTPVGAVAPGVPPNVLNIAVDKQGDFSTYVLSIGWRRQPDGSWRFNLPGIDRLFSVAAVGFRPGCPVDFDCAPRDDCPPAELPPEPALDYLAKDYASIRQLLLDVLAQRNPAMQERNPSDLSMALLELFAHEGDHLSYFQDAAANEAYLDTVRQRVSAKRHARLVDYTMHDGRNAWTHVHFQVAIDNTVPMGQALLTRVATPLRNQVAPPDVMIPSGVDLDFEADPALAGVRVFETATPVQAWVRNNLIRPHTWGNERCCLPRGTRIAHLYSALPSHLAVRPNIVPGDYLLLEEVLGPITGAAADADPLHRQVVQITRIRNDVTMVDPVYAEQLDLNDGLLPWVAGNPLPLLEVEWRSEDALRFPLCLSMKLPDGTPVRDISVARGNLVLADDGRTVGDRTPWGGHEPELLYEGPPLEGGMRLPLRLAQGPLTLQRQAHPAPDADQVDYNPVTGLITTPRPQLAGDARESRPAIVLRVEGLTTGTENWHAVPSLLDSGQFDREFVADLDSRGGAALRVGDDEYGRGLTGATKVSAWYRVGNGAAGNIGADALAHVALPVLGTASWPIILRIRNPLAAHDGQDAESIEEVRQYAPAAFRANLYRAVTESDYRSAVLTLDDVAGAAATFRWTGSWYTVLIGIDPKVADDLILQPGSRTQLSPSFEQRVRRQLSRYRLAGYDLEIRAARYIPLKIRIRLCVKPNHFRGDVAQAVAMALSGRFAGSGQGFFGPQNFTFGQPVYLSKLYEAVEKVEGVDYVEVTEFRRIDRDPPGELASGVLSIGPWEIARLDNDPNRMENGVLLIEAGGGK